MEATNLPGSWSPEGVDEQFRLPDWHSLRTRLGAAHAARSAIASLGNGDHQGSFSPACANALDILQHCLADVNRTALSNGKGVAGKSEDVAGEARTGGRG